MSDQFVIMNKLGSKKLWISSSKEFLPTVLKKMCDDYEKCSDSKKLIPVEVICNRVSATMMAIHNKKSFSREKKTVKVIHM